MKKKPLFSVITVVLNDEKSILKTVLSVCRQSYEDFEFLVIDGGSTDDTLNILKCYENTIDIFLSEPDNGIYDAMNKGAMNANGDWLIFMNSGDAFVSNEILHMVSGEIEDDVDVVYGNVIVDSRFGRRSRKAGNIRGIWKGLPFCHQSSFVRRKYLLSDPFDTRYKIAADYNFFFKLYLMDLRFRRLSFDIAIICADGFSDKNRRLALNERSHISELYEGGLIKKIYHFYCICAERVKSKIKKILAVVG